ncbi:MAG: cobyrinate a,c-diamide synthase [Leptolyngbyaceae cyanobacterium bins.302]|nr:cobyrinate a,c-diamide synthase [Leptolyngbyaceae cyanobacterium bins.302]
MSIIIAGERSGVGKTTVTLALLSYLRQQNFSVQSFKVGPDYIDPMFHQSVTGRPCRNLDPVLTSETYVRRCFSQHSQTADYGLVEGVMGLFDGAADEVGRQKAEERKSKAEEGIDGKDQAKVSPCFNQPFQARGGFGSTAHLARLLNLPVLLVVDCSRLSQSIAALVQGYCSFDPNLDIAGLVLNRVGSDRHLDLLQAALKPLNLPILGVLRRQDAITIPDRHLGLLPTAELPHLDALIKQLAHLAQECFDWEKLTPLLRQNITPEENPISPSPHLPIPPSSPSPQVRLAIAQDAAFSFYYADNLNLLQELGAELVFWSPLKDATLPDNVQGLIFGGGFPEVFAAELAANVSARTAVKAAIANGIPTYAECGGLMYLCEAILDFEEQAWEMVGVLPTTAVMGKRLTLGYRQAKAQQNGVMFAAGTIAWGHEFHRSHLTIEPTEPLLEVHSAQSEGWCYPNNLHASYIHFHWGATPGLPQRFLNQCLQFKSIQTIS